MVRKVLWLLKITEAGTILTNAQCSFAVSTERPSLLQFELLVAHHFTCCQPIVPNLACILRSLMPSQTTKQDLLICPDQVCWAAQCSSSGHLSGNFTNAAEAAEATLQQPSLSPVLSTRTIISMYSHFIEPVPIHFFVAFPCLSTKYQTWYTIDPIGAITHPKLKLLSFLPLFLSALAALYLPMVTESVIATLEFGHKESLLSLETFDESDVTRTFFQICLREGLKTGNLRSGWSKLFVKILYKMAK